MRDLYVLKNCPVLQNKVFNTRRLAQSCPVGDLALAQNEKTGVVENRLFDQAKVIYDGDYQNEQANSPCFRRHLQEVLEVFKSVYDGGTIVEVGCGKGTFFELLENSVGGGRYTVMTPLTRELILI